MHKGWQENIPFSNDIAMAIRHPKKNIEKSKEINFKINMEYYKGYCVHCTTSENTTRVIPKLPKANLSGKWNRNG